MIGGAEFANLRAFMVVVETRSFRQAAAQLGVTPSALSRTIKRLEEQMGLRLLNRTTRSVSPSEVGQALYARLLPVVADLQDAVEDTLARRGQAAGTLRINLPRLAAEILVMPRLGDFAALYPRIHLDMVVDDRLSDVVGKGFDAGIRMGELLHHDMIATRISPPFCSAIVGTPDYLATHGTPRLPQDLKHHRCINYRWDTSGQSWRWPLEQAGEQLEIDVEGPLSVNDTGLLRDAALSGVGLACINKSLVDQHLARGALVEVLEPWSKSYAGFFLYHPSKRQTPPALRALISFLIEKREGA
ncbi:LysR family transcriptional regulator [Sulfitobacter sp. LCG007]